MKRELPVIEPEYLSGWLAEQSITYDYKFAALPQTTERKRFCGSSWK